MAPVVVLMDTWSMVDSLVVGVWWYGLHLSPHHHPQPITLYTLPHNYHLISLPVKVMAPLLSGVSHILSCALQFRLIV